MAARLQAAQLVTVFITSQHAMQAECDIVMAFLLVCMSSAGIVCKRMDISSNFFDVLVGASFYFYQVPRCYNLQNSKGHCLSGGVKFTGDGKVLQTVSFILDTVVQDRAIVTK